jgi:hypothetical protein
MGALAIGMSVLMLFVDPVFAETYKNLKADLPEITKVLIAISEFSRHYWWLLLAAIGGGFFVFGKWTATERGTVSMGPNEAVAAGDRQHPEEGGCRQVLPQLRDRQPQRSPASPFDGACRASVGNSFYSQRILQMRKASSAARASPAWRRPRGSSLRWNCKMISVGEATGEVAEMMEQIATIHSEDVTYEVSKLSETIEPILPRHHGDHGGDPAAGCFHPVVEPWPGGAAIRQDIEPGRCSPQHPSAACPFALD